MRATCGRCDNNLVQVKSALKMLQSTRQYDMCLHSEPRGCVVYECPLSKYVFVEKQIGLWLDITLIMRLIVDRTTENYDKHAVGTEKIIMQIHVEWRRGEIMKHELTRTGHELERPSETGGSAASEYLPAPRACLLSWICLLHWYIDSARDEGRGYVGCRAFLA